MSGIFFSTMAIAESKTDSRELPPGAIFAPAAAFAANAEKCAAVSVAAAFKIIALA